MSQKQKWVASAVVSALAAFSLHSVAVAQMAPAPEGAVPPPTIDSNEDGKPDAWDRDGNGVPDAWDVNGDGKPDRFDDNGDGKPETKWKRNPKLNKSAFGSQGALFRRGRSNQYAPARLVYSTGRKSGTDR